MEATHLFTSAMLSRSTCPACGQGGPFPLFAESTVDGPLTDLAFSSRKQPEFMHLRLVVCPACDLLFSNPVPPPAAVGDAYAAAAFDSAEEARWASRTYGGLVDPLLRTLPDLVGALDIGTGEGSFLEELLARGFSQVVGVEPSAAPIAAARPEVRPNIRHGLFDAGAYAPGSLALVTCFQTLEHVFEPAALVRAAHGLLKPGGAFLAVCHDRRALSARLLGRKSPIFDIEHLQLFSPASGRALLQQAGFRQVRAKMIFNRYPLHYWLKLLPLPAGLRQRLHRWLKASALGRLPISLPAGNQVLLGIK